MEVTKETNKGQIDWARFNSSFIIEVTRGGEVFTSTAVAIGQNRILTAAHCVDIADDIVLIIGDNYQSPEKVISVNHWSIHPEYNPKNSFYENDLAILYLDEDLPAYTNIEVIEDDIDLSVHSFIERIGFGTRQDEKKRTWFTPNYIGTGHNNKSLLFEDFHVVVGDSGGPIYKEENGILKLIGLHSTFEDDHIICAVNLSCYKEWLESSWDYARKVV